MLLTSPLLPSWDTYGPHLQENTRVWVEKTSNK
jgi:hypothetical protein